MLYFEYKCSYAIIWYCLIRWVGQCSDIKHSSKITCSRHSEWYRWRWLSECQIWRNTKKAVIITHRYFNNILQLQNRIHGHNYYRGIYIYMRKKWHLNKPSLYMANNDDSHTTVPIDHILGDQFGIYIKHAPQIINLQHFKYISTCTCIYRSAHIICWENKSL